MFENARLAPSIWSNGAGAHCTYCRRELLPTSNERPVHETQATRDHVWPRAYRVIPDDYKGRRRVWSCYRCNHMKGNMDPDQWAAFMADTPFWWATPSLEFKHRSLKRYYRPHGSPDIHTLAVIAAIKLWRRVMPPSTRETGGPP